MGKDIDELAEDVESKLFVPDQDRHSIQASVSKQDTGVNGKGPHDAYRHRLTDIEELQQVLSEAPYDVDVRIRLAHAYKRLGYPDLAVGEAYKALLLIDEVLEEGGEYHEEALEAASSSIRSLIKHGITPDSSHSNGHQHGLSGAQALQSSDNPVVTDEDVVVWAKTYWSRAS
ncbi:uncharacterized protein BDZ99DRAFT_516145 [Mytilinidion resinicola]|uniref:Uncharacterized protein n=1 Tax=Mytilinidion resinicola TaxID=574789 RepID=A0A6A6Z2S1_9PEZI|nr:uncharacterized protein BDZ99DRAFT_516145 [Mytilinidion resinicola]KAF2815421.1 hypothetical protein BDZ99DRAFT_516145 [Mytilinidion resinicola]